MSTRHTEEVRSEQDGKLRMPRTLLAVSAGRVGRRLVRAVVISLVAVGVSPVATALGAPSVTIASPSNGSVTNNPTPTFSVLSEEEGNGKVTLTILEGVTSKGPTVQQLPMTFSSFGTWEVTATHLPDGTYTAQASETGALTNSVPVTFTVDTTPPIVTLTSPANGSSTTSGFQSVAGSGGEELDDAPTVTVQLFAGSSAGPQSPTEALTLPVVGGAWSGTFGGLTLGNYTVRAEQTDSAGNVGMSAPATFTVTTPPPPPVQAPPAASFKWFPAIPRTGENVSLVSSSTDTTSPITAFAWALSGNGAFQVGKPAITTSFSTPGDHVVQLRVTAGNGVSSVATQTIHVSSAPLLLMQPFPIVRIAGSETASGVSLRLLTAQAPPGARITVTCKGKGCPTKSESRIAVFSRRRGGASVVEFRRFERGLAAGVVLEIRVFKAGEIGKFTRFTVRRGKLPERGDSCLGPAGIKPIVCPAP